MLGQTTASGAVAAGLYGGADEAGQPVIPGTDQMLFWATESQNRLARLCLPIYDYAAVEAPSIGAQSLCTYTELISPVANRQMHQATDVYCNDRKLTAASIGYLRSGNWYSPAISGDPTAWSNIGTGIALSNYTTQPWFLVNGYFIPAPLITLTQELDPAIDDYSQIAMWAYVAWRLAMSNQDNIVLASRADWCLQEFVSTVREIYTRLIGNDSNLSALFVATNIDAQVDLMKQEMVKS